MSLDIELKDLLEGKCPLLTSCPLPKKESCNRVSFFRVCPEYITRKKKFLVPI
ncbi:MAG: hypothetical protein ACFFBP_13845 [Promethearchaeota archaeon]